MSSHLPSAAVHRGETLVLLSGMLGDETLWSAVVDGLPRDLSALCLRTDCAATVREVAARVLDSAPHRFSLAGHSFGAIVALEVFRQAPGRVTRIALTGASSRAGSPTQQQAWASMRRQCQDGDFATVAAELCEATLPASRRGGELVGRGLAMAKAVGVQGFLNQLAAQATRPDSSPSLTTIDIPALVLIGANDQICPPRLQVELAEGIPCAVTVQLENVGHMTPLEAPDAVADSLRAWLTTDPSFPTSHASPHRSSTVAAPEFRGNSRPHISRTHLYRKETPCLPRHRTPSSSARG